MPTACMPSCAASGRPPSPSPARMPRRWRLPSSAGLWPPGRADRRRGGLRARLAVRPRPLVLDGRAVARGSRLRRRATAGPRACRMTTRRRALLARAVSTLSLLAAPAIARAQDATLRDLARRATIQLFPVYEMYRMRWRATVDEANPQRQRLNRFRHIAQARRPSLADGDDAQQRHLLFVGLARPVARADVPHRAAGRAISITAMPSPTCSPTPSPR